MNDASLAIFAEHYPTTWDARTAAAKAGIEADEIVEALSSEIVQRVIAHHARMQEESQPARDARCEEVRAVLWAILQDTKIKAVDRINAADKLLKSYGGYIHRVQVGGFTGRGERRGLSDEQVDSIRGKVFGQKPRLVIEAKAKEKAG